MIFEWLQSPQAWFSTFETVKSSSFIVEQISCAIFQGGGLWSTTFVSIYQNVRIVL